MNEHPTTNPTDNNGPRKRWPISEKFLAELRAARERAQQAVRRRKAEGKRQRERGAR